MLHSEIVRKGAPLTGIYIMEMGTAQIYLSRKCCSLEPLPNDNSCLRNDLSCSMADLLRIQCGSMGYKCAFPRLK